MSGSAGPDQHGLTKTIAPESTPQSRAAERAARRRAAARGGATNGATTGAIDATAASGSTNGTSSSAAPDTQNRHRAFWVALTLTGLVIVIVIRLITLTPGDVKLRVTAATAVKVSGAPPRPNWPAAGQAALSVEGIGSLGSHGDSEAPTASLAKVMTAYLILKKYPLSGDGDGFTITVTPADASAEVSDTAQDESVVSVRAGEQLDERQLLEALLIPSGDNIAHMLAAYAAGSDGAFVSEMNAEARSLGMDHTTYTDPSGFDASTVSTASDQLKIFEQAMKYPVFRQIVSMPTVTLPVAGTMSNYDPLISDGYEGKTGSDSEAEGCLAFYKDETIDGRRVTVVGVVMGQGLGSDTDVILGAAGDAAADLVTSVTPALTVHTILPAGSPVVLATSADGHTVTAETTGPLRVFGWGGGTEVLKLRAATRAKSLRAGVTIGNASLARGLPPVGGAGRTSVRVTETLAAPGLSWRLSHLF